MNNQWVKTADRLPDKYDATRYYVSNKNRTPTDPWTLPGWLIIDHPELCEFWMPIPPLPEKEEQEPWPGDDLDRPNCGAMLEVVADGMLTCHLCGFADNDTAEVEE